MGLFGEISQAAKDAFVAEFAFRKDSWTNLLTGLGTSRDKRTAARFSADAYLTPEVLRPLYHGDDMAARAVELIVEDALKQGFQLTAADAVDAGSAKDEADDIQELLESVGAEEKVAEAATWGRLFGTGALFLGVKDNRDQSEPLNENGIVEFEALTVFDRRDLHVESYYGDSLKPKFGEPSLFRVQPQSMTMTTPAQAIQYVHESRLILFEGARTDRRTRIENQGWSLSVLQRIYEVLRDSNASWAATQHLMQDSNLAVFKIKNFLQMLAGKDTQDFQTRMEMLDMSKSVTRAYVCDADTEDYERKATSFAGYPEILDRTWQRLAAAANMPVTKLMGMSPAGMNATGEGDERMWGTAVEAYQRKRLKKPITRLARIAARVLKVKNPDQVAVTFPAYRQLTPQEEADRRLKVQQADTGYITSGVWLPEEVAVARVKGGAYSADPPIVDLEMRNRVLDKELASYEANAGKPPIPPPATAGKDPALQGGQATDLETGGGTVAPEDDVFQGGNTGTGAP